MIPRIIHYCWFGPSPKPPDVLKNIERWKQLHPDFKITEWNESNFDTSACDYVREAYAQRKFAFVSDYARGLALWQEGGVYLDCDVELVGRLDSFLHHIAFWGFEANNYVATSTIGCVPGYPLIKEYINQYHQRHFVGPDGKSDLTTNVVIINKLLEAQGLVRNGAKQKLRDQSVVYPMEIFSPLDYTLHLNHRDSTTVAIHHYQHSWGSPTARRKKKLLQALALLLGSKLYKKLQDICRR